MTYSYYCTPVKQFSPTAHHLSPLSLSHPILFSLTPHTHVSRPPPAPASIHTASPSSSCAAALAPLPSSRPGPLRAFSSQSWPRSLSSASADRKAAAARDLEVVKREGAVPRRAANPVVAATLSSSEAGVPHGRCGAKHESHHQPPRRIGAARENVCLHRSPVVEAAAVRRPGGGGRRRPPSRTPSRTPPALTPTYPSTSPRGCRSTSTSRTGPACSPKRAGASSSAMRSGGSRCCRWSSSSSPCALLSSCTCATTAQVGSSNRAYTITTNPRADELQKHEPLVPWILV